MASLAFMPLALARAGRHGSSHSSHASSHASAHSGSYRSHSTHTGHTRSTHGNRSQAARRSSSARSSRTYAGVKRDAHGRIARDPDAKEAFRMTHPCPATRKTYGACPGWVVDHVQALKHGGADAPRNMQWQTRAAAKAKDRWE
jgi:hypothetical protein